MTTGVKSIGSRIKKLGFENYKEYLASSHWQEIRRRFYRESKGVKRMMRKYGYLVCKFCREKKKLNLHHATYKRLGREFLGDLHLVCDDCHLLIHRNTTKKGLWRATYDTKRMVNRFLRRKVLQWQKNI